MNENAHLVYLTGISLDKKRLNYINENINYDIDFNNWLSAEESYLSSALSEIIEHLEKLHDEEGFHGKIYNWFDSTVSNSLNFIFTKAFGFPIPGLSVKPVMNRVFQEMGVLNLKDLKITNSYLVKLFKESESKLKSYMPGDFFSLYLSHQSDSIGVMPLSKLSLIKNYNFMPAYSDRDFYDNRYIDHITIKIRKNILSDNLESFEDIFNKVMYTHLTDIVLSNLLNDVEVKEKVNEKNINNFYDLIDKVTEEELKQVKNSLAERNFFGVNLLSLFLKALQANSKKNTFDIKIDNKKYDDDNISGEFLKELLEFSSEPGMFSIKQHDETDITFNIYSSNGLDLNEHDINTFEKSRIKELQRLKSLGEIQQDNNYKTLFNSLEEKDLNNKENLIKKIAAYEKEILFLNFDETFQRMHGLLNLSEEDRKNNLFKLIKSQISRIDIKSKSTKSNWEYLNEDSEFYYVKIPIKMVISIPINKDNKQEQKLSIPYMIDSDKNSNIDILTVGGAEHNRALAHLINKHRQEYKDKRIFGFMDNYFDFEHKIQKTKIDKNIEYADSFLMGLNQPVSGFNAILNMRTDDGIGDSINSDVKILGYRLNVDNKIYNIVSIYGFSALASVYGTHYVVSDIYYNFNQETYDNIFNTKYLSEMGPGLPYKKHKSYIDKGLTCILFHETNVKNLINEKFNNKSPLYIFNTNMKHYMEVFRDELVNRIDFGYQSFTRKK